MSGERGQAIVEFALTLPVLLLLTVGIVLVAEIGTVRLALEHAAAEAARTGALTNDDELIRATAAAAVSPLDPRLLKIAIEPRQTEQPRSSAPRGTLLRVRLRYPVAVPLGLIGVTHLVPEAVAARRIEWTP